MVQEYGGNSSGLSFEDGDFRISSQVKSGQVKSRRFGPKVRRFEAAEDGAVEAGLFHTVEGLHADYRAGNRKVGRG